MKPQHPSIPISVSNYHVVEEEGEGTHEEHPPGAPYGARRGIVMVAHLQVPDEAHEEEADNDSE